MAQVLVVDDDPSVSSVLAAHLKEAEHQVQTAGSAAEAIARIPENYDVMVVDMKMEGDESGLGVLQSARSHDRFCQVIVLTAYGTASNAVKAMEMGAFAYVLKEADATDMVLQQVRRALEYRAALKNLSASSRAINDTRQQLQAILPLVANCVAQLDMVRKGQTTLLSMLVSGGPQDPNSRT
jgi:two-component system response regulator PilR (NtrC family)